MSAGARLHILDLFSGLEGWSAPFRDRGHSVTTLDIDPRFGADWPIDFLAVDRLQDLEQGHRFDGVLASPPCDTFSTGSFRHHWRCITFCRSCGTENLRRLKVRQANAHLERLLDDYELFRDLGLPLAEDFLAILKRVAAALSEAPATEGSGDD